MRYSEQEAKIRRDAMRDEEFELLFGAGTQGPMTGIEPKFSWNADADKRAAIDYYNKHIKANEFDDIALPDKSGMLSGAWDSIRNFGKHLAKNNPVSLRVQEVQAGVDAYDNYWLTRLGHTGPPTVEDYNNEQDWENDYTRYWDERPLDYTWFNHYGD